MIGGADVDVVLGISDACVVGVVATVVDVVVATIVVDVVVEVVVVGIDTWLALDAELLPITLIAVTRTLRSVPRVMSAIVHVVAFDDVALEHVPPAVAHVVPPSFDVSMR